MADDVTFQTTTLATPPSGTKVATDDVGGVQYQKVKLDLGADGASSPVSGTVPVSDGGGALTVDNGGTFAVQDAAAEASLSVLDDWDESDRAKVNPIVGQAGVAAGAGTVSASTQRVALATDANAVKISDGTDTALVTSEGNLQTITPNRTASGTLGALNDAVTIACDGLSGIAYEIGSGLVGDVTFEATLDDSTWFSVLVDIDVATNYYRDTTLVQDLPHRGFFAQASYSQVRIRVSDYVSGSSSARLEGTSGHHQAGVVIIGPQNGSPAAVDVTGQLSVSDSAAIASLAAIESDADASRIALQLLDDTINTLGTATYTEAATRGSLIAAVRRDADTSAVNTDNEMAPLQVDANGRLKVEVFDGGDSHTVDGTVGVSSLPALVAGTANIGDVDVLTVPAPLSTTGGGTEATALRVTLATDSTGVVSVDDNGGALTVDGTVTANLAAGTNTNEVVGDVAHSITVAGNPLLLAGVSQDMDDTAPPNQVDAESDTTRLAVDRDGALFVRPFGPRIWSYHENSSSALTDATVHAAPAGGLSLYVTDIVVSTGAATALNVFFEEGASTVLGPYYLEAVSGRGFAIHFHTPKKITAATALTVTTSAAIAHSIDVTGFTAAG